MPCQQESLHSTVVGCTMFGDNDLRLAQHLVTCLPCLAFPLEEPRWDSAQYITTQQGVGQTVVIGCEVGKNTRESREIGLEKSCCS